MKELKVLGIVGLVVWVITALAALEVGLEHFGWGLRGMVTNHAPWLAVPLVYIVGVAGVISLLLAIKAIASGEHCCD